MESRKGALAALRKNLRSSHEELPVKKVSVMADSEEGLEEGLETAKDLMESGVVDEISDDIKDFETEETEKDISDEALALMSREDLIECVRKMRDEDLLDD